MDNNKETSVPDFTNIILQLFYRTKLNKSQDLLVFPEKKLITMRYVHLAVITHLAVHLAVITQ